MDHIEFIDKKIDPPTGVSSPSSAIVSGDEISLLDNEGNVRFVFSGLKTYLMVGGKRVLLDVDKDNLAEEKRPTLYYTTEGDLCKIGS